MSDTTNNVGESGRFEAPPLSAPAALATRAEFLPASATRVLMLVNRNAGARGGQGIAEQVAAAVTQSGFDVTRVDNYADLAGVSAELASEGSLRAVLAIGGDGTAGIALNATPDGTPLLVVPAGTENLLAKYLRTGARPRAVGGLLREGVTVRLDAGVADGRLFALMISSGFDAEVVRRVHSQRSGNITHLAYAQPILSAVQSYDYPPLHAEWDDTDGQRHESVGRWLFGVNLPRYAQGLPIVPEAQGDDGLLDLCLFERGGTAAGLWYLCHVLRRRRHRLSSVTSARLPSFRIHSPAADVAYQLDGDPGGVLPVDVSAAPGRMTLLVSVQTARRLGFEPPPA
ncbi:MAG: diacylglycerol kinase family protein [Planctomycetota bacterium]